MVITVIKNIAFDHALASQRTLWRHDYDVTQRAELHLSSTSFKKALKTDLFKSAYD